MANAVPWMTTTKLVDAIKRKIALPIYQSTFSVQDVIDFLNEELMLSQVPSIMLYHEEYFVYSVKVPLKSNVVRYAIPDRAIGMRMRDVSFSDLSGNLYEMTRISTEDRPFFQNNIGSNEIPYKFFIEGNEIVLTPLVLTAPTGSLVFAIYLRPNQLVTEDRAAIIQTFQKNLTIADNASLLANSSTATINDLTFTPVVGSPTSVYEFQIGMDESATAINLAAAINSSPLSSYITATTLAGVISILSSQYIITFNISDTVSYSYLTVQELICTTDIPLNITSGSLVDLLQTKPGHRTYRYDVKVPTGGVSGNSLVLNDSDMPPTMVVGDYVCSANECIIPQIPPDLHNGLAERASARILAAQGDQQGLQTVNAKIAEIEQRQGTLLDNRSEGNPQKIGSRHSLLKYARSGRNRF